MSDNHAHTRFCRIFGWRTLWLRSRSAPVRARMCCCAPGWIRSDRFAHARAHAARARAARARCVAAAFYLRFARTHARFRAHLLPGSLPLYTFIAYAFLRAPHLPRCVFLRRARYHLPRRTRTRARAPLWRGTFIIMIGRISPGRIRIDG